MTLPERWCAYARIQADLDARTTVDDVAWGLEAALDLLTESSVE